MEPDDVKHCRSIDFPHKAQLFAQMSQMTITYLYSVCDCVWVSVYGIGLCAFSESLPFMETASQKDNYCVMEGRVFLWVITRCRVSNIGTILVYLLWSVTIMESTPFTGTYCALHIIWMDAIELSLWNSRMRRFCNTVFHWKCGRSGGTIQVYYIVTYFIAVMLSCSDFINTKIIGAICCNSF